MQELLVLAAALTAIAVFFSFGYGIYALRLMRDQPKRFGLRLAALNLLEPSVTITTLLVMFFATDAANSSREAQLPLLLAGIPLTVMPAGYSSYSATASRGGSLRRAALAQHRRVVGHSVDQYCSR